MSRFQTAPAVLLVCSIALACGKKAEQATDSAVAVAPAPSPSVSAIALGRHLGSNNVVSDTASVFGRRDTIYVSVTVQNAAPTSALTAKWTFQTGQLVDSTSQAIARTDATNATTVTEFHISKKSAWPAGKYKVEIWLDGATVGSRDFQVK
ncbi:MAG: hypothetical protein MNPFHGCM_03195 [Gemmatimonadaceae bacterium]|nr:hypothetical protein [Gemmatimonadaceae bacterium]